MQKKHFIAVGAIATTLLAVAAGTAYALEKPKKAWICGKKTEGPAYIFKSGDEYIVAYPENTYGTNSYLITSNQEKLPKKWKPENSKTPTVNDSGFKYTSTYDYGNSISSSTTTFDIKRNLLSTKQDGSKEAPYSQKCIAQVWSDASSETEGKITGVPLDYLLQRTKLLEFLNPKLGDKEFNIKLADSLKDTPNGEYSVYKLLSSLDRSKLTTEQIDTVDQAKKKLLASSSNETTLWESSGMFTYNSSQESEESARQRCNAVSSSLSSYTSDGYEIVSSSAETKNRGWGLECQGTFYLLRKEGYID